MMRRFGPKGTLLTLGLSFSSSSYSGTKGNEPSTAPRNYKNHYSNLFAPKPQRVRFVSKFAEVEDADEELDTEVPTTPAPKKVVSQPKKFNKKEKKPFNETVAKIYEKDTQAKSNDDDDDVLKALEIPEAADDVVCEESNNEPTEGNGYVADALDDAEPEEEELSERTPFSAVKEHPFFENVMKATNRNMYRFRKEIRATGGYHHGVLNQCVRPLLQLADYPFTPEELHQLSSALNPQLLKNSLSDMGACRRFKLFYSPETNRILDWTDEDFLRRRYECIHQSWEPLNILFHRFNWSSDVLTDSDALLYFSKYTDFIDLAELKRGKDGKVKAEPIEDPVSRAETDPIPISRILVRRFADEFAEPSLTETIRLKGSPALEPPSKGKRRMKHNDETVSDVLESLENSMDNVDGDEPSRVKHAIHSVPAHRQTNRRDVVKEFALPRKEEMETVAVEEKEEMVNNHHHHNVEALTEEYHKTKVQVSLLRRQLLRTDDVDKVEAIQNRLTEARTKLSQLTQRLNSAQNSRHISEGNRPVGFVAHSSQPEYPEAPEFTEDEVQKNEMAAEDEALNSEIEKAMREMDEEEKIQTSAAETTTKEAGQPMADAVEAEEEEEEVLKMTTLEALESQRVSILAKLEDAQSRLTEVTQERDRVLESMEEKIKAVKLQLEELQSKLADTEEAEAEERKKIEEAQLEKEKMERVQALERQREEARKAQQEAEKALERQREAEKAALALEKQLKQETEDTVAEEMSMEEEPASSNVASPAAAQEEVEVEAEMEMEGEERLTSHEANDNDNDHENYETKSEPTTSGFVCSPEQYDGLHLAAVRLRREISALENQMEEEGDEDDETLMAVLAASRADLEELDDCIASVQANTTWAKARDAERKQEESKQVSQEVSEYQSLQDKIEQHRFSISLLEKRLAHTTKRSVLSKIEKDIIQARGEINKLRVEQDRLRKAGANAMGLPSSLSMAETLAFESRKSAAQRMAEEVRRVAEEDTSSGDTMKAEGREEVHQAQEEVEEPKEPIHEVPPLAASEAEKLRVRLNTMVHSIQHLQDSIGKNETNNASDADTESTLLEMKEKLTMLLSLRDDIQTRLVESSAKDATSGLKITSDGHEILSPSPVSPIGKTSPLAYPLSPATSRKKLRKSASRRIRHAAKKMRR